MNFTTKEISQVTEKIFEKYDMNSDEYIDRGELRNMLNFGLKQL